MKRLISAFAFLLFSIACSSNLRPQITPQVIQEYPPKPVTLKIYPEMSLAGFKGATVRVEYRIARSPDNRSYSISWGDGGGQWGGTGKSLDGNDEPYVFPEIWIKELFEGQYEVCLTVVRIENGQEKEYHTVKKFFVR